MARKALPHRMCDQRGPVDEGILKIAEGNPKGGLSAKKTFEYFSSFDKVFRSAMEWHRNTPGMASTEDTPEQQAKASAQITNNKKSGEPAVSRVLSRTVIHLEYMSPCISSDLPGSIVGHDLSLIHI